MATRSERDKSKTQQEKHQQILAKLLKEEDNKYCVDCDAKGPRWASWNLGVFLCIRCAGIHRNLGVHISKVKSVNLDTWTQEQLAMVQEMGNSRARAVYEANLPDHFRRPQTDSLEAFVRAKYEQKKYIAKEWVPPQPKVQPVVVEKEKRKARPRQTNTSIQLSGPAKSVATTRPEGKNIVSDVTAAPLPPKTEPVKKKESNIDDLIGLDSSVSAPAATSNDLFSDFIGADPAVECQSLGQPGSGQAGSASNGLEPSLFGNSAGSGEDKKSTKDSIMALYGSGNNQQNFGVPGGMYLPTPQQVPQQQQQAMQNGMMSNMMGQASMGMMGMAPGGHGASMMSQGMQCQQQQQQQPYHQLASGVEAGWETTTPSGGQYSGYYLPPQVMMGQMAAMPAMQSGNMMGGAAMGGMGQAGYNMGQPGYNMGQGGYSMGATGMYNMAAQQPVANQQFQQLANQMAGMSMGGPAMSTYQQPNGIAAGGATWGAPQAGQTLSTNLWQ